MKTIILAITILALQTVKVKAQPVIENTRQQLVSPDKQLVFSFYQKKLTDSTKAMYYSVAYKNTPIVLESALDLQLDNLLSEQAMALKIDRHAKWCENLEFTGVSHFSKDTTWQPVYGENKNIRDHYNALIVHFVKEDNPIYKIDIEVKVFNEAVAFRYFFPENEKGTYYRVTAENTEFAMPQNTKAWFTGWAQGAYQLLPLQQWPQQAERPLTMELQNGWQVCLAEAAMIDYARTKFTLAAGKPNTIQTAIYTPADLISPIATPWRVIMVAEKAADLVNNNFVLLNLNAPPAIKNTGWIKPGKIIRVMTQTTKDAFENIDFAAKHNMQYILFDWKWYGNAFSFDADATKVAIPDFDLPAIIKYGNEKGIGVWLYVNLQALYAQSDSLFAVYKNWGVKGVKFGFVIPGSHRWTTWIQNEFKLAAQNEIMVNVHDDWRPTGEQRTWPNLMTAEGIRGNEEMPSATHNTILPFTRFIAGAADYTICYYDKRIKTTHAHQLAMAAVYYSPIQTLFWYDKPAMSENEPELAFWDNIPASWDESKALQGSPGAYITMARRSGSNWFVGTLNNDTARTIQLSFGFLQPGKKYTATCFEDDENAPTKTKVGIRKWTIDSRSKKDVLLKAAGGQAIWITPQ
ncbi:glycoside hydrolase family 97 protein [Filimonas effusa]|uniref:Alpha-glucosidase n=1 Tax=Filimonas effusa TaxID=2508721 RepID=A0A4V1MAR9_9BACT|nr:glycoside hydrolase family 97 protein [Filimonas effusa]RXK86836.1 alpha-glucosidase [Filimonas effusa]